jgi:hypothetical protein
MSWRGVGFWGELGLVEDELWDVDDDVVVIEGLGMRMIFWHHQIAKIWFWCQIIRISNLYLITINSFSLFMMCFELIFNISLRSYLITLTFHSFQLSYKLFQVPTSILWTFPFHTIANNFKQQFHFVVTLQSNCQYLMLIDNYLQLSQII